MAREKRGRYYRVPESLLGVYRQWTIPDYYAVSSVDPDGFRSDAKTKKAIFSHLRRRLKERGNPSRHVRKSTGWMKARAVRIVKQHGRTVVQIKRSASRRKR